MKAKYKTHKSDRFLICFVLFLAVFFILTMLISNTRAAELDLRINAQLNDTSSTVYLETNDDCNNNYDGDDALLPSNPDTLPSIFYSNITVNKLAVDCWNKSSNPRTILLFFNTSQQGLLTLSWNSPGSSFTGSLADCADHVNFNNCFSDETDISSQSSYETMKSVNPLYFKLILSDQTTTPSTNGTTLGNSGGGGGGSEAAQKPSLRIDIPGAIFIEQAGTITFNISLENNGNINLQDLLLNGKVIVDGQLKSTPVNLVNNSFKDFFIGRKEIVEVSTTIDSDQILIYEVNITATSKVPVYSNNAKVYLTFIGKNGSGIIKIVAFADGLINDNSECAELKSMLEEAKMDLKKGDSRAALEKAQRAIEACKKILETSKRPQRSVFRKDNMVLYLIIAIIIAIAFGIAFNIYKRWKFNKPIK